MEASSYDNKVFYEFGGPIGTFLFIIFSHFLVYYLWVSLTYYQGSFIYPSGLNDIIPFISRMWHSIATGAAPSLYAAVIYLGFLALQFTIAYTMPGIWMKGLPVPSEGNVKHNYLCNGIVCWYVTLLTVFILHFTGIFPITELANHLGNLLTVAVITADIAAVAIYILPIIKRKQYRMSGNIIYDFFMGSMLNPRIGIIDLKFFFDIRISWTFLFLLTLSAAAKQYQLIGTVSSSMTIMLVAHWLYTNACMKGEECVPTTWDIFYEKCGWMLTYWNFVGVPFVYSFQSYYILKNNPQLSMGFSIFVMVLLLCAYYVWETANSQKNSFRMQLRGTYIKRTTFPQLPWRTLKDPKYLTTANGSTLLTDGWYKYTRKIHYTADIVMGLCWALSCGFTGILPYFYPLFFFLMIMHRYNRDSTRCAKKYGEDWVRYCKIVPYRFIPFIY